jgi:hypothetical protein
MEEVQGALFKDVIRVLRVQQRFVITMVGGSVVKVPTVGIC